MAAKDELRTSRAGWAAATPAAGDGDDELLAARARCDPAAFATLYRRHVDALFRFCWRRLGNREAAEDATSLTFVRALEALPGYRGGSFRAWLFTIAHNVTANARRDGVARAASPLDLAGEVADHGVDVEEAALAAEARSTVRRLLAELPPADRELLELRLAGLTGPEIAAVLGRSPGAVKVAQFRALARLRERLDPERTEPGR